MGAPPDTLREFKDRLGHFKRKFFTITEKIIRGILLSPEVGYLIVIVALGALALKVFTGYIDFIAIITLCLFLIIILGLSMMRDAKN